MAENIQLPRIALTLTEAATAAKVSEPIMRKLVYTPGFPAFRAGRKWVIPIDGLNEWLNQQARAHMAFGDGALHACNE